MKILLRTFICTSIALTLTACCSAKGRSNVQGDGEPGAYVRETDEYSASTRAERHTTEYNASDESGYCRGYSTWWRN